MIPINYIDATLLEIKHIAILCLSTESQLNTNSKTMDVTPQLREKLASKW